MIARIVVVAAIVGLAGLAALLAAAIRRAEEIGREMDDFL